MPRYRDRGTIAGRATIAGRKRRFRAKACPALENRQEQTKLAKQMRYVEAVIKMFDPGYSLRAMSMKRRTPNPWFKAVANLTGSILGSLRNLKGKGVERLPRQARRGGGWLPPDFVVDTVWEKIGNETRM
jgi:hypothetical protein